MDPPATQAQDTGRIQNKTIVSVESPDFWIQFDGNRLVFVKCWVFWGLCFGSSNCFLQKSLLCGKEEK